MDFDDLNGVLDYEQFVRSDSDTKNQFKKPILEEVTRLLEFERGTIEMDNKNLRTSLVDFLTHFQIEFSIFHHLWIRMSGNRTTPTMIPVFSVAQLWESTINAFERLGFEVGHLRNLPSVDDKKVGLPPNIVVLAKLIDHKYGGFVHMLDKKYLTQRKRGNGLYFYLKRSEYGKNLPFSVARYRPSMSDRLSTFCVLCSDQRRNSPNIYMDAEYNIPLEWQQTILGTIWNHSLAFSVAHSLKDLQNITADVREQAIHGTPHPLRLVSMDNYLFYLERHIEQEYGNDEEDEVEENIAVKRKLGDC